MSRDKPMWVTNLQILVIVLGTVGIYTLLANAIPQVQSEVPEELSFSGEVSVEELVAAGEDLYEGAGGCTACHGLGTRAPNLLADEAGTGEIGARCGSRVPDMDCKEYLYASMTDPNAYVVEGYQPIMPDMRRTLSEPQIWAAIAYLQSRGGEVTVTGEDVQETEAQGGGQTAGGAAAEGMESASLEPTQILNDLQCLACHQLAGEGAQLGPPFDGIGSRLDAAYIRRSILDPAAEIADGYDQFAGVMPANFGSRLTAAQLEAVVSFLADLQ